MSGHCVQFYKADEPLFNRNVAGFLWDGLLRGDGLLVIATRQRRESLVAHLGRLGADVALARRDGQLVMLDSHETLAQFMDSGQRPDWEAFRETIEDALARANGRVAGAGICAYGEMVGVLWEQGHHEAAIRVEEYWNRLLHAGGIDLFCGYPIDIFTNEFQNGPIQEVFRMHTHVVPTGPNGDLGDALRRAMDELLNGSAETLRSSMLEGVATSDATLPQAEREILWLRTNLPSRAEEILARARAYYNQSQGGGEPNSLLVAG